MYEDAQPLASYRGTSKYRRYRYRTVGTYGTEVGTMVPRYRGTYLERETFNDISFGMCLVLMSWVQ